MGLRAPAKGGGGSSTALVATILLSTVAVANVAHVASLWGLPVPRVSIDIAVTPGVAPTRSPHDDGDVACGRAGPTASGLRFLDASASRLLWGDRPNAVALVRDDLDVPVAIATSAAGGAVDTRDASRWLCAAMSPGVALTPRIADGGPDGTAAAVRCLKVQQTGTVPRGSSPSGGNDAIVRLHRIPLGLMTLSVFAVADTRTSSSSSTSDADVARFVATTLRCTPVQDLATWAAAHSASQLFGIQGRGAPSLADVTAPHAVASEQPVLLVDVAASLRHAGPGVDAKGGTARVPTNLALLAVEFESPRPYDVLMPQDQTPVRVRVVTKDSGQPVPNIANQNGGCLAHSTEIGSSPGGTLNMDAPCSPVDVVARLNPAWGKDWARVCLHVHRQDGAFVSGSPQYIGPQLGCFAPGALDGAIGGFTPGDHAIAAYAIDGRDTMVSHVAVAHFHVTEDAALVARANASYAARTGAHPERVEIPAAAHGVQHGAQGPSISSAGGWTPVGDDASLEPRRV